MTADLIRESGEVLVHGIAISPGKPTIIGRADGIPVIGLPGHPASAFIVLLVIARPLLFGMTGQKEREERQRAWCSVKISLPHRGREDYIRVRIRRERYTRSLVNPGSVNTLIRSDGLVRVPPGVEGLEVGDMGGGDPLVKRYLSVRSLEEVLGILSRRNSRQGVSPVMSRLKNRWEESLPGPFFATYSVPEAVLAAMDGIAVRSEDTWGAGEQRPVTLTDLRG